MQQVFFFFIQYQKNNAALQTIHWHCLDIQLNHEFWIYFLLQVKIKTALKISQFSCFHYIYACFHVIVKPIR